MTKNELKRLIQSCRCMERKDVDKLCDIAEGVLRLPEEKKMININTSYPNMGGTNNQFDIGFNQCLTDVKKAVGLED